MEESKVFMFPEGNKSSIDPALLAAMNNNGGFGNGGGWMWMMFMWILFPWIFGNNGFGKNMPMGNGVGQDLLLQAINGRADALNQLAGMLNTSVGNVQSAVNQVQSAVQTVGAQVGLSGAQVINSVQSGNASLSKQLCECCCENRLAIANQTSTLQSSLASHDADVRLQMAQSDAESRLAISQQTNQLGSQSDRNTNSILNAISAQNTLITKEFCDLKERELQNKINTQSDLITQLRGQISNDEQSKAFNQAFNTLNDKIAGIAAKQPNTVPVTWPNLTAVNNTPYAYGVYGQNSFWN